jgi:hypothetical protein
MLCSYLIISLLKGRLCSYEFLSFISEPYGYSTLHA